jgi:hypothetical protein
MVGRILSLSLSLWQLLGGVLAFVLVSTGRASRKSFVRCGDRCDCSWILLAVRGGCSYGLCALPEINKWLPYLSRWRGTFGAGFLVCGRFLVYWVIPCIRPPGFVTALSRSGGCSCRFINGVSAVRMLWGRTGHVSVHAFTTSGVGVRCRYLFICVSCLIS